MECMSHWVKETSNDDAYVGMRRNELYGYMSNEIMAFLVMDRT